MGKLKKLKFLFFVYGNQILKNLIFNIFWLIFSILPGIFLITDRNKNLKETFKWPSDFIKEHPVAFISWIIAIPILNFIFEYIKKKEFYGIYSPEETPMLLANTIDSVVAFKQDRFLKFLKDFLKKKKQKTTINKAEYIFKGITQPREQIIKIAEAIYNFFFGLLMIMKVKGANVRVVIAGFDKNNKIDEENTFYLPSDRHPGNDLLGDKNSIIYIAREKKRTILIDDIKKAKKDNEISRYCETEEGSAIAYPVKCSHTGEIPYVIRIVIDKDFFNKKNLKLYEGILERFGKRILIEYALLKLREHI